jgi:ABC-type nitrate/sulfonate/bicarbonate transport system substrate-binding protein
VNHHPSRSRGALAAPLALSVVISLVVLACGSPAPSVPASSAVSTSSSSAAAPSSVAASASASPASATPASTPIATPAGVTTKVRLALDWTPNTNHLGFFVAQAKGWYEGAGVELEVLPYGGTAPEAILAAHQAECGISFQDSMTFAVAAGAPIVSVMAILQHTAQDIAVMADSPILRPKELDGKVYAGFGYPNEVPTIQSVIRADGGKGTFDTVTLDTAAYEALYSKRADFAITFAAWEGIEAAQRGINLRTFRFTDFGFPDFYQVVLACDRDWLARDPAAAKGFVGATARGLGFAALSPDEAASILVSANPGIFDANPDLPKASAAYLAEQRLFLDPHAGVGTQTLEKWSGYSGFLYAQGLLVDGSGAKLAAPPDYASLFTNEFLP